MQNNSMTPATAEPSAKRRFAGAPGSAKLCLKPNCGEIATSRGLCPSCYRVARTLVKEHKTTWEKLEQTGRCKAAKYCRESSTRDWMLCLDSDGGHIHELHANDTLSPNMSYCRFQNTSRDLKDCEEALNNVLAGETLSEDEQQACAELIATSARIATLVSEEWNWTIESLTEHRNFHRLKQMVKKIAKDHDKESDDTDDTAESR